VRIDRIGVMNREAGAQSHHLLTPWALAQGENHLQCPSADKPTASQSLPLGVPGRYDRDCVLRRWRPCDD